MMGVSSFAPQGNLVARVIAAHPRKKVACEHHVCTQGRPDDSEKAAPPVPQAVRAIDAPGTNE